MNDRERLNDVQHILADDLKELIAEYFEGKYPFANHRANHLLAMQLAFYLADHGVAVQKHGRWVKRYLDGEDMSGKPCEIMYACNCSECGLNGNAPTNYCPNCGAKMMEDSNDKI